MDVDLYRSHLRVGGGQDEHGAEGRHRPGSSIASLFIVIIVLILLCRQRLCVGVLVDWIREGQAHEGNRKNEVC